MSILSKFLILSILCIYVHSKTLLFETELNNILNVQDCLTENKICHEVAHIQVYYETFCPGCISFETYKLQGAIVKMSQYMEIKTYPYGNAFTYNTTGKIIFFCQHGEQECYGNMLHACALDIITNHTEALLYNICMMEPINGMGSDDAAADRCAASIPANSTAIKACAKSERGAKLLEYYGDETIKSHLPYVPYVLVNGIQYADDDEEDFITFVCRHFKDPPKECTTNY